MRGGDENGEAGAEIRSEALDEVHRTVATAGAADGDRERAAVLLSVRGQPRLDEAADILEHGADLRLSLEKRDHRGVEAGERAQPGVVVRIGEAANVEDEVGVERHALLVAEGLEQEHHRLGPDVEKVLDPVAQRVREQVGRVQALADLAYRGEDLALARQALLESARSGRERVAPARFGEAAYQRVVLGIEEKQAQIHSLGLQRGDVSGDPLERVPGAGVDAHRDPLVAGAAQQLRRLLEQLAREVVDAVVAAVLERIEGDALAGARQPADEDQLHSDTLPQSFFLISARCLSMNSAVECMPRSWS